MPSENVDGKGVNKPPSSVPAGSGCS